MKKFNIYKYDEWNDTYSEVDLRDELKRVLRLNIEEESVFDSVIDLFSRGEINKIEIKL